MPETIRKAKDREEDKKKVQIMKEKERKTLEV